MKNKDIKMNLKCMLTDDELRLAGSELADTTIEIQQIEADKKRVVADFGARITEREMRATQLSNKIQTRYDFRDVKCKVQFNDPEVGRKTIVRLDSFDTVRTEDMSGAEMQEELEFEKQVEAASAARTEPVPEPVKTAEVRSETTE